MERRDKTGAWSRGLSGYALLVSDISVQDDYGLYGQVKVTINFDQYQVVANKAIERMIASAKEKE